MSPLMSGITIVVILLIVASLALAIRGYVRNAHDVQWPRRDGTSVLATITDVQIKQDWKEGERWERSTWDGSLVRQRTWQTYYDVTAQWMHSQTKQSYTFRSKVCHCLHRRSSSSSAICGGLAVLILSEAYAWLHFFALEYREKARHFLE